MQRPKSEGLGAAFGGGVTENIFGAQTTNVLVKFTTWLAGMFFVLTFALSVLYAHQSTASSAFRRELMKTQGAPPASPPPAGAKPSPVSSPGTPPAQASPASSPACLTPAPAYRLLAVLHHRRRPPVRRNGNRETDVAAAADTVGRSSATPDSLRFAREFRREQPEKFCFLGFWIDVEQCDAGLGKLEASARQRGDHAAKVRLMADEHQNF